MQSIEFEPAFVIHTRPYRDTSVIATFFTLNQGVVAGVVRGQRQIKKKQAKTPLLPFSPFLVSLQGRSSLKLVSHIELDGASYSLQGRALYSGLYLNELLIRLLPEWDAQAELYRDYRWSVNALAEGGDIEVILRQFESRLLDALGVNISWQHEAGTGDPISAQSYYRLDVQAGFVPLANDDVNGAIAGLEIIQVGQGDWHKVAVKRLAKFVHRQLLRPLLGAKPLQSRQFFQ